MYSYMFVYINVYMYICIYMCAGTYIYMYICIYIFIHTHTLTRTHTHTHTHIHIYKIYIQIYPSSVAGLILKSTWYNSNNNQKGSVNQRGHHCSAFARRELSTCVHQAKKILKSLMSYCIWLPMRSDYLLILVFTTNGCFLLQSDCLLTFQNFRILEFLLSMCVHQPHICMYVCTYACMHVCKYVYMYI
jgi:hypothetical protein